MVSWAKGTGTAERMMQRKADNIISAGREQATEVLNRLQNQAIGDYLGDSRGMDIAYSPIDGVVLETQGSGTGRRDFGFHSNAVQQMSARFGLPNKWIREQMNADEDWRQERVADILNSEIKMADNQRLLVRSVNDEARAVLSDRYRRLDSSMITESFARACREVGAVPYRASMTDLRWRISVMLPEAIEVDLPNHRSEVVVACAHIGNSDFGSGTNNIAFEIMKLICTNGMIGTNVLRTVHLGRSLNDDLRLSQSTYDLDSRAQAGTVYDLTKQVFADNYIENKLSKLEEAADERIEDAPKTVDGYVKAKRISKSEGEQVVKALTDRDDSAGIPEGPVTRYSMAQALSWVAQSADTDRRHEVETLAGAMVGI